MGWYTNWKGAELPDIGAGLQGLAAVGRGQLGCIGHHPVAPEVLGGMQCAIGGVDQDVALGPVHRVGRQADGSRDAGQLGPEIIVFDAVAQAFGRGGRTALGGLRQHQHELVSPVARGDVVFTQAEVDVRFP